MYVPVKIGLDGGMAVAELKFKTCRDVGFCLRRHFAMCYSFFQLRMLRTVYLSTVIREVPSGSSALIKFDELFDSKIQSFLPNFQLPVDILHIYMAK